MNLQEAPKCLGTPATQACTSPGEAGGTRTHVWRKLAEVRATHPSHLDALSAPRAGQAGPCPLLEAREPTSPQHMGQETPDWIYPQVPGWGL